MAIAADDWDTPLGGKAKGLSREPGDFMRDGRGTPWVSDPTGELVKTGERKGQVRWVRYGRPSSFGKDIENTYNLDRWNERQIAFGMTVPDDELTKRIVALADLDRDSDAGKNAADAIVVHAKRLAKAGIAAERGTHIHAVTEDDDTEVDWLLRAERGEVLDVPITVQAAMLEAWRLMCVAYDLEIVAVEQRVVHDGWHLAGTLDRKVRLGRDIVFANGVTLPAGSTRLGDVKSGRLKRSAGGVIQYWHSYAIQCAAYADGVPYDCATDTRLLDPHPVEKDWALIFHLPVDEALAGKAVCRLVLVDLNAARQVIDEVIQPMKAWRAREDLFALCHADEPCIEIAIDMPDAPAVEDTALVEQLEASIAQVRSVRHEFTTAPVELQRPPVGDEGDLISKDQHATIKAKVLELHPEARALLSGLAKAANDAGQPFSIGAGQTRRRWNIYRALLRLGGHYGAELSDDLVRATLAIVLPDAAQLGVALGPAIGSLTLDEAQRFVQAAQVVLATDPALHIDDNGHPRWAGVSLPAA